MCEVPSCLPISTSLRPSTTICGRLWNGAWRKRNMAKRACAWPAHCSRFGIREGIVSEGRAWLARALANPAAPSAGAARAKVLYGAGCLAHCRRRLHVGQDPPGEKCGPMASVRLGRLDRSGSHAFRFGTGHAGARRPCHGPRPRQRGDRYLSRAG